MISCAQGVKSILEELILCFEKFVAVKMSDVFLPIMTAIFVGVVAVSIIVLLLMFTQQQDVGLTSEVAF